MGTATLEAELLCRVASLRAIGSLSPKHSQLARYQPVSARARHARMRLINPLRFNLFFLLPHCSPTLIYIDFQSPANRMFLPPYRDRTECCSKPELPRRVRGFYRDFSGISCRF